MDCIIAAWIKLFWTSQPEPSKSKAQLTLQILPSRSQDLFHLRHCKEAVRLYAVTKRFSVDFLSGQIALLSCYLPNPNRRKKRTNFVLMNVAPRTAHNFLISVSFHDIPNKMKPFPMRNLFTSESCTFYNQRWIQAPG